MIRPTSSTVGSAQATAATASRAPIDAARSVKLHARRANASGDSAIGNVPSRQTYPRTPEGVVAIGIRQASATASLVLHPREKQNSGCTNADHVEASDSRS